MFGRRRRVAPVAPVIPPPVPELSDAQIFELLHIQIARLVGAQGQWTLVPRSSDDTDVIFHDLKANQIASSLASVLRTETAVLRGEVTAEPTALPFIPAPISVWAEPERAPTATLPRFSAAASTNNARLVA
ncbi:hypothetical protein [Cryobacterium sp. M23]|uniref:hypothetical protein n=1 Tax=Cryobacterium sp. M23 TaxID=2048292 RepID=UPI000CE55B7A|nr:hypothetical protein [Cryobacterium sp. M23]